MANLALLQAARWALYALERLEEDEDVDPEMVAALQAAVEREQAKLAF